jgi:hypothetical protein
MKLILLLVSCIVAGAFRSLNRVSSPLRGNRLSILSMVNIENIAVAIPSSHPPVDAKQLIIKPIVAF